MSASAPALASNCTFTSVTGPNFGSYDVMAATALDATGTIVFNCTLGLFVSVSLSKGNSGSYASRTMLNGVNQLSYNLYLDAAHSQVWGDGTLGSVMDGPSLISIATTTLTVYGHLPARQNVPVGSYTDSITVTLNF